MAGDTIITVVGNLTADPEIRFTPSGAAVANFTIASTPRTFDRATSEWKDGETLFLNCSVWRQVAENVADSLKRGTRVIAQGRLKQRRYETKEGEKRTVVELEVDEIGPSLRTASAAVTKNPRGTGGSGGSGGSGGWGGAGDATRDTDGYRGGSAPAVQQQSGRGGGNGRGEMEDPWRTSAATSDGWGTWPPENAGQSDQPPF